MEKKTDFKQQPTTIFDASTQFVDDDTESGAEQISADGAVYDSEKSDASSISAPQLSKTSDARKKRIRRVGKMTTKALAYTAIMTALVYVGSLIGYSGPQFYFNLGDAVILITAALLNPVSAMIAGGLGSFLCDLTVYPATMVFTLFIKAIEGLVAGILFQLINRRYDNTVAKTDGNESDDDKIRLRRAYVLKIVFSSLAALISVTIMMLGYFMCQTLFYGTINGALVALPFDAAQGVISSAVSMLALYALKFDNFRHKLNFK